MSHLKLAVIGAGHLGRIHARLASALPTIELVAVVDPIAAAREAVAGEFAAQAVADYRQLYGKIDAAVVATPTFLHHQVGMDLLQAGVHLLIEKPLAPTASQCQELVAAAQAGGLVLQVGHVERFNPALAAVAEHVRAPRYIDATRASGYTFRSTDIGVVLDLMIHDIDVVLSLIDSPVVGVQALGQAIFGGQEDMAQARITFENGAVANLSASRASFAPQRTMHIYTERCYAGIDFSGPAAKLVRPAAALTSGAFQPDTLSPAEKAHYREHLFRDLLPLEELQPAGRNAIEDELVDFHTAITTGSTPRVTGAHGQRAVDLAEQIIHQITAPTPQTTLQGPHWLHSAKTHPNHANHQKAS